MIPERSTARDAAETEYLGATFENMQFYGVPNPQQTVDEDGEARASDGWQVFQVISKRGTFSRPHLMPTFDTPDDPVLTKRLALEIVPCHWGPMPHPEGADSVGGVRQPDVDDLHTYPDGDPEWIDARTLAGWEVLGHQMITWSKVVPSPTEECVIVLTGKVRAKPPYDMLDPRCPALCVKFELENRGWIPVANHVTHMKDNMKVLQYFGKEAMKMKVYYQVLLDLGTSLRYCARIPSTEPVKFYELILRGVHVEAGQSNKIYVALMNKDKGKKGEDQEPLPIQAAPPALALDDDDGTMLPSRRVEPKPKPKPRAISGGVRRPRALPAPTTTTPPPVPMPPPPVHPTRTPPSIIDVPPAREPLPPGPGEPEPSPPVVRDMEDDDMYVPPPPPAAVEPRPKRQKRTDRRDVFDALDGAKVTFEIWVDPSTDRPYPNWIIQCSHHQDCYTSRKDIDLHKKQYGTLEPLAYLHSWLPLLPDEGRTHRAKHPTKADTAAYFEARRDDLQDLKDRLPF